ncbi:MAG: PEGA domain-containing protein [Myxococcales bacterium]|nr:PEGA domain-containing protein [Myxococcales bacterium]
MAFAALSLPPAVARAQGPAAADVDRAAELFKKAKALHTSGKLSDALGLYTQAWALHQSPDIAANLAACELALNKHRDAAEHFEFALRRMLAGTTPEQKARLTQGFEKAKKEVATLKLEVEPAGAEVKLDDKVVGKSPLDADVFAEPGTHELVVTAAGFAAHSQKVTAQKGGVHALRVSLEREAKVVEPAAGGAEPKGQEPVGPVGDGGKTGGGTDPRWVVGIVGGGLTVLAIGAGVAFKMKASSSEDDETRLGDELDALGANACAGGGVGAARDKCADYAAAVDDRQSAGRWSNVSFYAAAGLGVATVAAVLVWPSKKQEVALSGWASPESSGLFLHGKF